MKKLLAVLLALSCVGCAWTEQVARDYTLDIANEVNQLAFEGKVRFEIQFCDRNKNKECDRHHGAYIPGVQLIHVAPEWYWEPYLYFKGEVAHEMIHAYLSQTNKEAGGNSPHSWKFMQERDRVAQAIDLPEWAIPNGKKSGDKLDATRMMAYLEKYLQANINRVHGHVYRDSVSSPGWPTVLYDDENWRDMPPPGVK